MTSDEQAIRDLVATWLQATAAGDLPKVLSLMAEDAVFLTPGRPPIRGREEFAGLSEGGLGFDLEFDSNIEELSVYGDWAHCWNKLSIRMTPKQGGAIIRRSGDILTLFRKQPSGAWVVVRDANMLVREE